MNANGHHRHSIVVVLAMGTLVALCLVAWMAWEARNSIAVDGSRQRQYVEEWLAKQQNALQSGDQSDVYFYDTRNTNTLLRKFADNSAIKQLTFELTDLSDEGVRTIAELPNIEALTLYGGMPRVGDRGLELLRGHSSLATLKLVNIDVTDRGLRVLDTIPHLRNLTLYRDGFRDKLLTDGAVRELRNLTRLAKLNICGGWMSTSAITDLRESLPECDVEVDAAWMHADEQSDELSRGGNKRVENGESTHRPVIPVVRPCAGVPVGEK